jgi:hypothetical protein
MHGQFPGSHTGAPHHRPVDDHKRLIRQVTENIQYILLFESVAGADEFGSLQSPTANEHAETANQPLLGFIQQSVAPVQGGQ